MSYCHIDEKRGSNSELPPSFISFIPSRAKPAPARPACRKGMHPPRRSALRRSAQAGTRPQPCSRRGGRQAAQPRPQQKGRLPKGADACSPICACTCSTSSDAMCGESGRRSAAPVSSSASRRATARRFASPSAWPPGHAQTPRWIWCAISVLSPAAFTTNAELVMCATRFSRVSTVSGNLSA